VRDQTERRCEVTLGGQVPDAVLSSLQQRFEDVHLTPERTRLVVSGVDQSAVRAFVTFLWDVGLDVRSMTSEVHPA
jgi:hypothetical protein